MVIKLGKQKRSRKQQNDNGESRGWKLTFSVTFSRLRRHIMWIVCVIGIIFLCGYQIKFSHTKTSNLFVTRIYSSNFSHSEHHQQQQDKEPYNYPFKFSSCLLIKDDNQILPEWLAYHYTVMPLRYLIVGIDPLSITDPRPILDRFSKELPDLHIESWTGNWYWLDGKWSREKYGTFDPYNHTGDVSFAMHNIRQARFYASCLRSLQSRDDVRWAFVVDSDEYFTYNTILDCEKEKVRGANEHQILQSKFPQRIHLPQKIGKQNETIAHWINHIETETKPGAYEDKLCLGYPRIQMSAKDENDSFTKTAIIPPNFNLKSFHTLQYTAHWDPFRKSFPGKSLINLRSVNPKQQVANPHSIYRQCKSQVFPSVKNDNLAFRVNHYSGSLETFLSRPERNVGMWHRKNNFTIAGHDYSLLGWFDEFIKLVGDTQRAYDLTQALRDQAYRESIDIKIRVEQHNEIIPLVYDWDKPWPPEDQQHRERFGSWNDR